MTNPTFLPSVSYPYPRTSDGLSDGYTDISGGDYLQANVSGSQTSLNFNAAAAEFQVTAGGVTGKQIIIPAAWFGGNITWVRGLYALSATPRYAAFMADFNAGDTTNYGDFTQAASNNYASGVLSTTIPVAAAVAVGTTLQAYYSYRTSTQSVKGQAMSGWPQLHADPYQGTANDGDNYLMMALYHAWRTTGNLTYKTLALKIGNAVLAAGRWHSNYNPFRISFEGEEGQSGIYWYNAPTTPFSITSVARPDGEAGNSLQIDTTVESGGYAGFGMWPSFPIDTTLTSVDISVFGDGSKRLLKLATNIDPAKAASGDVSVMIPMISAGTFAHHSFVSADFWHVGNVVYDAAHVDYTYKGSYGSNTKSIIPYVDQATNRIIWEFDFDFTGNGSGYAGMYFGAASASSAATTNFNFNFYSRFAGTVTFTAKDSTATNYVCTKTVVAGWQSFSIPWIGALNTGFSQTTFTHPVTQFYVDTTSAMPAGAFRVDNARYDAVVTMGAATVLNGIQISFPSATGAIPFLVNFEYINIVAGIIDGPVADPTSYMGIPRWTYKWTGSGADIGYGAWRGPSGVGYNWLSGWAESGIVNPDNSRAIATSMLQMMYDSQQAYKTQFPAKQIGPFVPRYGRTSWEALTTGGYVAGVWTASTYNKWYWPGTDDWYGYTMRALLSVARYYYLTGSAQAKTILDNWMAWLDVYIVADGAYWWPPSGYGNDGNPTYTYKPEYAYTCIAAACIYKYFVDGDALALKWYRRMLDDMYARKRQTATGTLAGIYPTAEGNGYTTASVVFSCDGVAPTATAFIAGGKITHFAVVTAGSGMTHCSATVTGDGSGATGNAYLSDDLVGAFSTSHAGWEAAEILNTYALMVNGGPAGGTVNFPLTATANDIAALNGLIAFYQRTTRSTRPSMLNENQIPFHEYCVDPYHNSAGIENPMVKDTHVKGAMWTETTGPTLYAAVEYGRKTGDYGWLEKMFNLTCEFTGVI